MKIFGIQVGNKSGVELAIDEALVLIDEKRFDDAVKVIEDKALAREPDNRRAILHLGVCYMLKEDYDEAERVLEPLMRQRQMDSEKAAAHIALDKIKTLRKEREKGEGK